VKIDYINIKNSILFFSFSLSKPDGL